MRPLARLTALFVLLGLSSCDLIDPGPPKYRVGTDYAYTLDASCATACDIRIPNGRYFIGPIRIEVSGGEVTQATFLNQNDPEVSPEQLIAFAPTLARLRQIAQRVAELEDGSVDYDSEYGFPTRISYCYANCSASNRYSATDFEPR